MDNTRTIEALTQLIDNLILSGDYPGLEDIIGTRRDKNGDLIVEFSPRGRAGETPALRVQITTAR